MCSVESSIGGTPILSSSSSTSSLESAALALSGECSVVELETTSPRVPVSSSLYSTKRLSLPFCEAWIEQLPVLVIAGLGRGPLGRPSSVVGLHREVGLGFARGIGLGLVTASGGSCSPGPTSPSPYSSVQDLSIFADAEDDFSPSSLSCGSSSGTVLAGSLSDLDEDDVDMASTGCAARDSIKRLSDLFDALSVSFSASSLQLSDHKRFSVLDAYDESDYDESDGDDDSLERLEDVIVRIGRSRREVFVYAA
ncbi:hypothetical protein C8Q80DRAFT_260272 [Daedaleopsis nitida]|nr:hypothetical protein C8Q80DRAFT_260272 [Daedaleopsis nitida]